MRILTVSKITIVTALGVIALAGNLCAITRVAPAPEVGGHVFSATMGTSNSFEDGASGGGRAWSIGYLYHANNPVGIGFTVGENKPEDFFCTYGIVSGQCETKFSYYTVTIDVRNPTREKFVPFAQGGFGLYQLESNNPLQSFEDDDFGMYFGLGLEYLVDPAVGVGVSGNLHYTSLDTNNPANDGLGDWLNTWDLKAVVSVYVK